MSAGPRLGGAAVGGQRRKKGGRVTPKGGTRTARLTAEDWAGLEAIFDRLLRAAPKDLTEDLPPLEVERWASQVWAVWAKRELIGMDAVDVFAGGFIRYAAQRATPAGLMVLRALAAVAPEPYASRARRHADRLAAGGLAERAWAAKVGTGTPTTAWMSFDPIDDDGASVMVEFDGPGEPSTVCVYMDHNLGGIAKDAFVAPAGLDVVLAKLCEAHEGSGGPEYCRIPLDEAAARWREGLAMTDMTLDPPVSEEFHRVTALVRSRLARLPSGDEVPPAPRLGEEGREELVTEFLESDEMSTLWRAGEGDEDHDVEHLAYQLMTFSLDYVSGTPLRFSPVMVEIFCLDWAPRKIAGDGDIFTLLPDVLAAWIRFVGHRRGIPEEEIKSAVKAGYTYAPEMIKLAQEPENWGPAKTLALAVQQRGVDITDQTALDHFIDEVNRGGGIDVLAESLAGAIAPHR